jgi:hypothetical protein
VGAGVVVLMAPDQVRPREVEIYYPKVRALVEMDPSEKGCELRVKLGRANFCAISLPWDLFRAGARKSALSSTPEISVTKWLPFRLERLRHGSARDARKPDIVILRLGGKFLITMDQNIKELHRIGGRARSELKSEIEKVQGRANTKRD